MLKYKVKYEDFDGEEQEEDFYFNINKTELFELEVEYKEGLEKYLEKIVKANDQKTLFAEFKRIILLAYGVKSEDGKKFIKNDEVRTEFANHAAFDAMVVRFATEEDALVNFIKGVLPKDLGPEVDKNIADLKALEEAKKAQTPNS